MNAIYRVLSRYPNFDVLNTIFYNDLKPYSDEVIILKEFEPLVELIRQDLNSIVNEKTNLTIAIISHIINNITVADPRLRLIKIKQKNSFKK